MRLFDTHAHYDSGAFNADRLEVLASMPEQGVELILNPGCELESSKTAVELSERFPFVYAAVGVHPSDCGEWEAGWLDKLRQLAARPKVRAIGEIGLDYYWKENPPRELQQEVFRRQMELAHPRPGGPPGLPVHCPGVSPGAGGVPLLLGQPGGRQDPGEAGVDAVLYRGGHLQKRPQGPGGHPVAAHGSDHD